MLLCWTESESRPAVNITAIICGRINETQKYKLKEIMTVVLAEMNRGEIKIKKEKHEK